MGKALFIAEKPSVAKEFAKALGENMTSKNGHLESQSYVVTWCVGHLVTMSYPEKYDPSLKKWNLNRLPFIPETFLYEVIPSASKQYQIVAELLNRNDVSTIYVCTDSGREGEYIYRLVEKQANVTGKERKRVWIDSQTEEEIHRGIKEAKNLSEYDNLAEAAYLRAKEDYLMGINFSRLLTLKYGDSISKFLHTKYSVISVGRVMTCVLGMVVKREREIRDFVKTPFYRVMNQMVLSDAKIDGEWRVTPSSRYFQSPKLYKENGFLQREEAQELINALSAKEPVQCKVVKMENKQERKNPPLLYNLAELQNECSKFFKISPDETLQIVQELYEKKMVTYPRTDARVLSSAVAKEIQKNISGLKQINVVSDFAEEILATGSYKNIAKSRYVNDKQITDHYAIIPTGQGYQQLKNLKPLAAKVYEAIVRRFLAIFYPPAVYRKIGLVTETDGESFFSNFKVLSEPGYLKIMEYTFFQKKAKEVSEDETKEDDEESLDGAMLEAVSKLKKGDVLQVLDFSIKEGETSPPKRYNSGSMILAMENAGQLIEDEELRAQIKGCGIGTSATRAEILKKLVTNKYLSLNKKTQIITPTLMGEMIYDVVSASIRSLLNPELTASWEKGLNYVAEGSISGKEYMDKLDDFVRRRTQIVKQMQNQSGLSRCYEEAAKYYKKGSKE